MPSISLQRILAHEQSYGQVRARVMKKALDLMASVFTRDLYQAQQVWGTLEVGGVVLDDVPSYRVDNMPYGGVKDAGLVAQA